MDNSEPAIEQVIEKSVQSPVVQSPGSSILDEEIKADNQEDIPITVSLVERDNQDTELCHRGFELLLSYKL